MSRFFPPLQSALSAVNAVKCRVFLPPLGWEAYLQPLGRKAGGGIKKAEGYRLKKHCLLSE